MISKKKGSMNRVNNKNFAKFGLNQNAKVVKFEIATPTWSDEPHLLREIEIKGQIFRDYIREPSEELKETVQNAIFEGIYLTLMALGVSEEAQIDKAMEKPAKTWVIFLKRMVKLLPKNFQEIPIDVFCQWQRKIAKNQSKTYLEITTLSFNPFICAHVDSETAFEETVNKDGSVTYINAEGVVHPLMGSSFLMDSPSGKQQKEDEDTTTGISKKKKVRRIPADELPDHEEDEDMEYSIEEDEDEDEIWD